MHSLTLSSQEMMHVKPYFYVWKKITIKAPNLSQNVGSVHLLSGCWELKMHVENLC